ncbi:MAG: glycosyltransferase family 2 protein [Erysipelotrichaceae bacterium]|nr:glycosyltransferase family 2 protein [Erysipelotrichaceae bacterium]MBQ6494214.1 glycosyltransferase family 2 protein [Erysipelotrichaceae bacterium]
MKKKISIAIPCYRSESTIGRLTEEITKEMKKHKEFSYEIILVNDCSPDNTFNIIADLARKDEHIIAYDLSKNFGESSALMAAFSKASGDYIVRMDDDGEHDPKYLFQLIDKLEEGYDYVCAEFKNYHHTLYKRIGSKFNYWFLTKMMDIPSCSIMSSYNVTRRYVINEILKYENPKPYIDGMVWAVTTKTASVPIEHGYRYAGESGYNFSKSVALWLNGVTSFSIKPLRLASLSGFIFAFCGFVIGLIVIIDKLIHPEVEAGWTSMFATLLFIGGFIMIFLGLIGEYVGRGYLISNHIPQYVIREEVRKEKAKGSKK